MTAVSSDVLGWSVVVPTVGRPQLRAMLDSLAATLQRCPEVAAPAAVVVVDDRPLGSAADGSPARPGPLPLPAEHGLPLHVVRSGGRGPAAARNAGWRTAAATASPPRWVAFLDDDVVLPPGWAGRLAEDLAKADVDDVAAVQARIVVPLPAHRRPTDWERSTAGLERAAWATADMAYRLDVLRRVAGFDERFPRAYREDADLALRVRQAGGTLRRGSRTVTHPVRPADDHVSLRVQRGNRDDALMRALHGPRWRQDAEVGRGRLPWHTATVAAAGAAAGLAAAHRPRPAALAAGVWAALTADFLRRRVLPGPRPGEEGFAAELRRMAVTSVAIPFAAVAHRARGAWQHRRALGGVAPAPWPVPVRALLLDRDGTLVHDVPYNGDPALVVPFDGARRALDAARARGLRLGVVSNQSGIGRGLLTPAQVDAVQARVESLLGPFGTWQRCPHVPEDACGCRKPEPGMVLRAAAALGVAPAECAVVGDIGADVGAALAAGARTVLVPTPETRPEEVAAAPLVAVSLEEAVRLL
ncbi:HAD family hydrolase [Xylanimonas oleitrophica]|uniref:D,D-heptose 1,7-bisphosphate phosphatase n=1 Tax=Xylanimonas oleitrophica TaxID=2607479 RepID=A0A2W5XRB6_9MICO|nr:HAD-IIIA family hydrolase [Xylanimonas oleitrophica]PZR52178.1 HAD family hydrolase [Xylanimonas oleitrophica]